MNRAGSPKGGRKETAAKGPSKKTSVEPKAAKPAAKTVKGALKRVKNEATESLNQATRQGHEAVKRLNQAASGLAKKIAKSVTSITKKSVEKAGKVAKKTAPPAKKAAPAAKAPAKTAAKAPAKTVAKAPAKTAEKAASKKPAPKTKTEKPAKKAAETPKAAPQVKPKPPSRKLRPKSFGELETARGFGFPEETPELPESYGEDRLVLMTKDPEYLFAYWEITPERRALAERAKHGREEYREALRLTWTSADLLEDSFVLLPVSLDAKRWYLRVPFSGLSYHIEIGWLGEQGHFISVLGSSNPSDAPESWAKTRKRLLASDAAALEYSVRMTHPLGSSESARPLPASKKKLPLRNYEGPGAQSSSDAAVKIPAAAKGKRS